MKSSAQDSREAETDCWLTHLQKVFDQFVEIAVDWIDVDVQVEFEGNSDQVPNGEGGRRIPAVCVGLWSISFSVFIFFSPVFPDLTPNVSSKVDPLNRFPNRSWNWYVLLMAYNSNLTSISVLRFDMILLNSDFVILHNSTMIRSQTSQSIGNIAPYLSSKSRRCLLIQAYLYFIEPRCPFFREIVGYIPAVVDWWTTLIDPSSHDCPGPIKPALFSSLFFNFVCLLLGFKLNEFLNSSVICWFPGHSPIVLWFVGFHCID